MEIFEIALSVFFIYGCFQEGMIFGKVGNYLETRLPEWLYFALIGCPACMTPYWGTLLYFTYGCQGDILPTVLSASGMNLIIMVYYEYFTDDSTGD